MVLLYSLCRRVVLYSHGNAIDLGLCINNMVILGKEFNCDFIYYDYEGYGYSNGDPHGKNLPRDLKAVYDYARQFFAGEDIFLAGESSICYYHVNNSWKCSNVLCGWTTLGCL